MGPSARVRLGFPRDTNLGIEPGAYWGWEQLQEEVFITRRDPLGGYKKLLVDWRLLLL